MGEPTQICVTPDSCPALGTWQSLWQQSMIFCVEKKRFEICILCAFWSFSHSSFQKWNESYLHVYLCFVRCIPKYRVCLSDLSECPQYECIGHPATCDRNSKEPACDTDGLVHRSLCHLHQAGKTLAYRGRCEVGFTRKGLGAEPGAF